MEKLIYMELLGIGVGFFGLIVGCVFIYNGLSNLINRKYIKYKEEMGNDINEVDDLLNNDDLDYYLGD